MDRCHLIPAQRIRREIGRETWEQHRFAANQYIWHPDVWVWGCRAHHSAFDAKILNVQRLHLPRRVERFAEAFGLGWSLDADYGLREEDEAIERIRFGGSQNFPPDMRE
jgi:hypothetical protein